MDQASNVGGVVSAARLRESFMRREAKATNDEQREALRDAIGTIEVRFPEIEGLPIGSAEKFARERGHGRGARSPSHEGRSRRRSTSKHKPDAAPLERAANRVGTPAKDHRPAASDRQRPSASRSSSSRRSASTTTRAKRSSSSVGDRARSRGRRAYRETGIPAAGASTSQIVMSTLGASVGLSAVYLILSSAERGGSGTSPLIGLLQGATGFLRRIVAPVDFFGRQLSQRDYAAAVAGPGSSAALAAQLPRLKPINGGPGRVNPQLRKQVRELKSLKGVTK